MALLDGEPRSAGAVAVEDTSCLKIEYDDFYNLISENVEIVKGIFTVLTKRLRSMLKTDEQV